MSSPSGETKCSPPSCIAAYRRQTVSDTVAGIDLARRHSNLSSAIRLFVLDHCPLQPTALPAHPVSALARLAAVGLPE